MKYQYTLLLALLLLNAIAASGQDLVWGAQIDDSDTGHLYIHDNAVDKHGNLHIAGQFTGTIDMDPGQGTYLLQSPRNNGAFIAKYDAGGNLLWANAIVADTDISLGSDITAMTLDDAGNVYTTGYFVATTDFDPGPDVYTLVSDSGRPDMFVLQLDAMGNFGKVIQFPGTYNERSLDIAVDAVHDIYLTGTLGGGIVDIDPSPAVYELKSAGEFDAFFLKISDDALVWAKTISGTQRQYPAAIDLDIDGSVYLTGYHIGTSDFDPGTGVYDLYSNGYQDVFIAKYDNFGELLWAHSFGDIHSDMAVSLVCDKAGNTYTIGTFAKNVDFDPGTGVHGLTSAGLVDIFILKLDLNGNFRWVKQIGGSKNDIVSSIALWDRSVIIANYFTDSIDLDPGPGNFYKGTAGKWQTGYISLDEAGKFKGGLMLDTFFPIVGSILATNDPTTLYATGRYIGTFDCDPGPAIHNLASPQNTFSHYLLKYDLSGMTTEVRTAPGLNKIYSIYPNPGKGIINIAAKERIDRVVVTDMVGRVVYDINPAQNEISLEITEPGVYIVSLIVAQAVINEKVVMNSFQR